MAKQREGNPGIAQELAEPAALAKIEVLQVDQGLSEVNGPALAGEPATAEEAVLAFVRGLPSDINVALSSGLGLMQFRLEGIREEALKKVAKDLEERFGNDAEIGWSWQTGVGSLSLVLGADHPVRMLANERIQAGLQTAGLNPRAYEHLGHLFEPQYASAA